MARRGTERSTITRFMWRERIISAPRRRNKKGLTTRKLSLIARPRPHAKGCRWKDDSEMEKISERWLPRRERGERRATRRPAELRSQPRATIAWSSTSKRRVARRERQLPIQPYLAFRFPSIPRNNWLFRDPEKILAALIIPRVFAQLRWQLHWELQLRSFTRDRARRIPSSVGFSEISMRLARCVIVRKDIVDKTACKNYRPSFFVALQNFYSSPFRSASPLA